ncbi:MAG: peptidase M28 [Bacteroidetes bacterium HGW-Bacteroidetes-21]|nr:MAG: peptidase M28 [Bacteroidetes bacterium HGW-Bacteroidetes-21]
MKIHIIDYQKIKHYSKLNFFTFLFAVGFLFNSLISCKTTCPVSQFSDTTRLRNDMMIITGTEKYRNYMHPETLDSVAAYIFSEFSKNCDTVYYQTFEIEGQIYRNVIGATGISNEKRMVVGAHYDVAYSQPGADDNASGVVALLELSRMTKKEKLNYRVDFVAFALEEPPYFKTTKMGSYIHAKDLFDKGIALEGMICFDMIGYFSDEPNSQTYPIKILKPFYGSKGNYITVVKKLFGGVFGHKVEKYMKEAGCIETKAFTGPKSLPGIDFSDHLNYWKFGYPAVMITNTAFYRNEGYHTQADTIGTINFLKMSQVIDEVFYTLKNYK